MVKIILITVNIFLCLLNVVMAYSNYENGKYKYAIFSGFAAGFSASAVVIAIM